ncbi:multiple C2 and transmembrane domain-containing protein isoform X1 [Plutella xylostella]|uniref:multiple C2 and transmembrane domain-containing protein isoform X1 n=1 Tax=Plutella xylostella TaxID=51655 RepID=UPI002032EB8F|nr:multiple C2 and transmembrane domain-containing protein isoform X1 [Plutella xylostella]
MSGKVSEENGLGPLHFPNFHKRVQNKYEEMQKRLEKAKSIDSFLMVDDDEIVKVDNEFRETENDLKEETVHVVQRPISRESLLVEEAEIQDVFYEDSSSLNARQRCISLQNINEASYSVVYKSKSDTVFFADNFRNNSLDSLNEIGKENAEVISLSPAPATPPKISIRDRIGSRINAAKERRMEKAKNAAIQKKKKEPRQEKEKIEKQVILSSTTKRDVIKLKRNKKATVTVALIEAKGFRETSIDFKRSLSCRFRLGLEKYKSKVVKNHTPVVKWGELLNLGMYDEQVLEISLWEKETYLGRCDYDLSKVEKEKTHKINIKLDELPDITIFVLLTITGTTIDESIFESVENIDTMKQVENIAQTHKWYHFKEDYTDVGCLSVVVYGAMGLVSNECHCILQLDNDRVQTATEYKTNEPQWMKMFTFTVKDVTSLLEVTVHDEKKGENIGRISIPLLRIRNGEKKWYALKDNSERHRAKGDNPRILIEMSLQWNLIKSSRRIINPKELRFLEAEEKLDRHVFQRNLARAKKVVRWNISTFQLIKACFEWEDKRMNFIALVVWLLGCCFLKVWMLPLFFLIPFVYYRPPNFYFVNWQYEPYQGHRLDEEDDENSKNDKEQKTSLRQKIYSFQEMLQSVQSFIGDIACFGEQVKNLFNFTVPYLSYLAIFLLLVIALVLYLVPIEYILMAWSIRKYTRKILQPHREPNNEVLDLISRVPHDDVLLKCQELALEKSEEIII